jgi:hypothetical protein
MLHIFLNGSFHHKNWNALQKYKNIKIYTDWNDISKCSVILSPGSFIPIEYPDKVYIFGPHFSVFPDNKFFTYLNHWKKNSTYNFLSDWVINCWSQCMNNQDIFDKVIKLPFGVETEKFHEIKPVSDRNQVFLYYKRRLPDELLKVESFFKAKNIAYTLFNYEARYDEDYYLSYLQNSKYGVILDAHESQGFAIQEALSCNVPLLVWNVTSMKQEHGSTYEDYSTTSIPYWDERCGEYFFDEHDLEKTFELFMSKIETYRPRDFILENLSMEKCEERLFDLVKNIQSKM